MIEITDPKVLEALHVLLDLSDGSEITSVHPTRLVVNYRNGHGYYKTAAVDLDWKPEK